MWHNNAIIYITIKFTLERVHMNTIAKENAILQTIKYLPSSFMVLLILSAITYISIQHNNDLKKEKLKIEKEYLTSNKERIKLDIDVVNRYIQTLLNDSVVQLEKELDERIGVAHNIALNIYNKNKNRLPKKEIIKQIKYAIEPMRFDDDRGYFSIHTMDGINILNPAFKYLEGTSVLNRKDDMGHYPVQEALKIVKTQDTGFMTWDYYKPGDTSKIYEKFGIVKKFAPYNLIITTAIFKEDFENSLKKEMLRHFSEIEYMDNGYIFVIDGNTKALVSQTKKEDKKYNDIHFLLKLQSFINSSQKSTYLEYSHQKDSKIYSKISYFLKVENIDWIIATGFNLDKLNVNVENEQQALKKRYHKKMNTILFWAGVSTLLFLMLSILFSKVLKKMFYNYKKQIIDKEEEKVNNYLQTIFSLVDLIEKRDFYTAGHSRRVAQYSVAIAKKMNFSKEDLKILEQIGLLHDIGKIAIPDSILLKPGRLTKQEFDIIKSHASIGYEVIEKIPMFTKFSNIILSHHERYDGSGYPDGLKGDEIPILASILSIADSFDAMTSTRIYNKTKTREDALTELSRCAGTLYDPKVLHIALEALKNIDIQVPLQAKQLPTTPIEKERFAYFFKDPLTSFSNENYLTLLLAQGLHQFKCLNLILIHGFSTYNKKYGWKKGDELIKEIAKSISKSYEAEDIFRFHGSNFILLNKQHKQLDLSILDKKIEQYDVNCELHHLDMDDFTTIDMVEEYLNK